MYISEIVWRPQNPVLPKILILGESHYDEDIPQGEENKHITREVVEYMLDEAPEWKTFFYNIAASFGYRKDKEEVTNDPISSNYTVGKTNYKKGVSFDREIQLKKDLTLYGFNHASRSGYKKAYEFISKEFEYHDILNKSV